jgi:3-methylfumaryl-CoA hydratase
VTVVERTEVLVPGPAEGLAGLLGVPVPDLDAGLPLLWHTVYLLDRPREDVLGADGHPVEGGMPAPPGPGLRRMFAGGRVRTSGVLRCGERATRRTRVVGTVEKSGRTGPLTFVTVAHEISQGGAVVVTEEQDIVYRPPAATVDRPLLDPVEAPTPSPADWKVSPTATLLFRYSALTYNAHRIHYDRDYARDVEGYPGLVVHGPLQALLMAEATRREQVGPPADQVFSYRLLAPLFAGDALTVRVAHEDDGHITSVHDATGRRTAAGRMGRPLS